MINFDAMNFDHYLENAPAIQANQQGAGATGQGAGAAGQGAGAAGQPRTANVTVGGQTFITSEEVGLIITALERNVVQYAKAHGAANARQEIHNMNPINFCNAANQRHQIQENPW